MSEWDEESKGFRNSETGEVTQRRQPGAMWYANESWSESIGNPGPDGKHLFVQTPSGPWGIDSDASNCTRKGELHHCWVRHGIAPNITVDKNGETCGCGHSIAIPSDCSGYHGFLTDGYLVEV